MVTTNSEKVVIVEITLICFFTLIRKVGICLMRVSTFLAANSNGNRDSGSRLVNLYPRTYYERISDKFLVKFVSMKTKRNETKVRKKDYIYGRWTNHT